MTRPVRTRANTTKDYSAIAKAKITTPAGKAKANGGQVRRPSILVYSRNKKGKTRFCLTAGRGKVLVVDPEQGTDRFIKAAPHVWHLGDWSEIDDIYKYLRSGQHEYEWVAFDGCTRIANMALRHVTKRAEERDLNRAPGITRIQDYGAAGELFKGMLYNFHTLPLGKIYTAQERQIDGGDGEDEDEDVEVSNVQYVPDLPKGSRAALNSIVDVIGRIYIAKVPDKGGNNTAQRRLWLAPSVVYDTGARSEFKLPDYLANPTVPRLVSLIEGNK